MERRVSDLERRSERIETKLDQLGDQLTHIQARLEQMPTARDLESIRAKVDHLPGKSFLISTVVGIVGLVVAAIALAPYVRVPAG